MQRTSSISSYLAFFVACATSIAACSTTAADEAAAQSETAQTSDEDCEKPLPDPASTFNAVALQELQIFEIRDDLAGVSPVPGAFVPVNAEMAIYALNPRTGWCQTSALNFEFIRCDRSKIRINRAPTWQVPGDVMTFMNNVDFQLPDMMIPSVDRAAIAAFGDAQTLAPSSIFDIDGGGSFVSRGASVPGGVTVGMYAQRGRWIQSSVWLQLIDVGAPPGSTGTRLSAPQCKKGKRGTGASCNSDSDCKSGKCSTKAGNKCSPETCAGGSRDTGLCRCDRHETLQKAVHDECDTPPQSCANRACCSAVHVAIGNLNRCLASRRQITAECFAGNANQGHIDAVRNKEANLANCVKIRDSRGDDRCTTGC